MSKTFKFLIEVLADRLTPEEAEILVEDALDGLRSIIRFSDGINEDGLAK